MTVTCPSCGTAMSMEAVGSVNADRRPDLRDAILGSRFQDVKCASCGTSFRLPPQFTYIDIGRGQWIASLPADKIGEHAAESEKVRTSFADTFGANAGAPAQAIGAGLTVRLTFGWPALREKLLVRDVGLDDVVLELLKLDLFRRLPKAQMGPGRELRLTALAENQLAFSWIDAATEETFGDFRADRRFYDAIAGRLDAWKEVRDALADGPFVDMLKLVLGDNG
jgi:hypothetical protein